MSAIIDDVQKVTRKLHKSLECSICLDILEEPQSTQCNHRFCRKCINQLFLRKTGKASVTCPLCKTSLSKRGLSQSKMLVDVVAAIRNVLTSINEDTARTGTPASRNTRIGKCQNEVSEETPFQVPRSSASMEKDSTLESDKFQDGGIGGGSNQCSTRRSRKLHWSEEGDTENRELLRNFERADLGGVQTSNIQQLDKEKISTKSVNEDKGNRKDHPVQFTFGAKASDILCDGQKNQLDKKRPSREDAVEDLQCDIVGKPTKQVVPETPYLQIQDRDAKDNILENLENIAGRIHRSKKTSPFSTVTMKAPTRAPRHNQFDFVHVNPLDNSDLCERVKQRRKKLDATFNRKQKNQENSVRKFYSRGNSSVENDQQTVTSEDATSRTKVSNGKTKHYHGGKSLAKMGGRRSDARGLLKGAWGADEGGSSQLIDSCSSVDLTDARCMSPSGDFATINVPDGKSIEVSSNRVLERRESSYGSHQFSLPEDDPENGMLFEESQSLPIYSAAESANGEKTACLDKGNDIVPASMQTPDCSILGPINPMQSPLYEKYRRSNESKQPIDAIVTGDTRTSISEERVIRNSSSKDTGLQSDKEEASRLMEKISLNLCSESGSDDIVDKEHSVISNVENLDVKKVASDIIGRENISDRTIKSRNEQGKDSIIQHGECAKELCTDHEMDESSDETSNSTYLKDRISSHGIQWLIQTHGGVEANSEQSVSDDIIPVDIVVEPLASCAEALDDTFNEEVKVVIDFESLARTGLECGGKDLPEAEFDSSDSALTLCKGEPFSQDTFSDDGSDDAMISASATSVPISLAKELPREPENQSTVSTSLHDTSDKKEVRCVRSTELSKQEGYTQPSISIVAAEGETNISPASTGAAYAQGFTPIESCDVVAMDEDAKADAMECEEDFLVLEGMKYAASVGCQTSSAALDALFSEVMSKAPINNAKEADSAKVCSECRRNILSVPTRIFERVKENIQSKLTREDSTVLIISRNYPMNLVTSGAVVKESQLLPIEASPSADKGDIGIRIERLSFVPMWMTAGKDERKAQGDEPATLVESKKTNRASKRNLMKRFKDESKQNAEKVKSSGKVITMFEIENESSVENRIGRRYPGKAVGNKRSAKGRFDKFATEHVSNFLTTQKTGEQSDVTQNVNRSSCFESVVDEHASEEVKDEEIDTLNNQNGKGNGFRCSDDVIPPTPLSDIESLDQTVFLKTSKPSREDNGPICDATIRRKSVERVAKNNMRRLSKGVASKSAKLNYENSNIVNEMDDDSEIILSLRMEKDATFDHWTERNGESISSSGTESSGNPVERIETGVSNIEESSITPSDDVNRCVFEQLNTVLTQKGDEEISPVDRKDAIVSVEAPITDGLQNKGTNCDESREANSDEGTKKILPNDVALHSSVTNVNNNEVTTRMKDSKERFHRDLCGGYTEDYEQDLFASDGQEEFYQAEENSQVVRVEGATGDCTDGQEEVPTSRQKTARGDMDAVYSIQHDESEQSCNEVKKNFEHAIQDAKGIICTSLLENDVVIECMSDEPSVGNPSHSKSNDDSYPNKRIVPDFMELVKEFAKGRMEHTRHDDSDDEQSFIDPCIERNEKEMADRHSDDQILLKEEGRNAEEVEFQDDPASLTPPPRIKRKRASPPEVQAVLKEIKELVQSAEREEEDLGVNEAKKVRRAELQLADINLMNLENSKVPNKPEEKAEFKSASHLKVNWIEDRQKIDRIQDFSKLSLDSNTKRTPKTGFNENPCGLDRRDSVQSHEMEKMQTGVITTPKFASENLLSEKRIQVVNIRTNDTRILVPSRLSKKQMIGCKYLSSKINCKFSTSYVSETSHLIMGSDENYVIDRFAYTYKYLMALITGSWIVSFKWVLACLDAGEAVDEDQFEVKGDPTSNQEMVPTFARLSKQRKEPPLFHDLTLSLIGDFQFCSINKTQLIALLVEGGASILFDLPETIPPTNYLLIFDSENINSDLKRKFINSNIQPIHYEWITESIINFKVQNPTEFLLKL